jgi:hypothetical protein
MAFNISHRDFVALLNAVGAQEALPSRAADKCPPERDDAKDSLVRVGRKRGSSIDRLLGEVGARIVTLPSTPRRPQFKGEVHAPKVPTVNHFILRPEHPVAWQVRQFLASLPMIRIVLDTECGGFGHPAGATDIIAHLRELGYPGALHILFSGGNEAKLPSLMPGFQAGQERQVLPDGSVAERFREGMKLPWAPLTFASPDGHSISDTQTYGAKYNTRVFCALQPTAWPGAEFIEMDGRLQRFKFQPNGAVLFAQPKAAQRPQREVLATCQPAVSEFFAKLLQESEAGKQEFGVTYFGHGQWEQLGGIPPHKQLGETVAALKDAQKQIGRPVVHLAFGEDPARVTVSLARLLQGEHDGCMPKVRPGPDESGAKLTVSPQVTVVLMPRQPKPVYELLSLKGRLPPASEGAGATNNNMACGRPHLHASRAPDGIWEPARKGTEWDAYREASSVLEGEHKGSRTDRVRILSSFMVRTAHGDNAEWFATLGRDYRSQVDKVGAGVRVIMAAHPRLGQPDEAEED